MYETALIYPSSTNNKSQQPAAERHPPPSLGGPCDPGSLSFGVINKVGDVEKELEEEAAGTPSTNRQREHVQVELDLVSSEDEAKRGLVRSVSQN